MKNISSLFWSLSCLLFLTSCMNSENNTTDQEIDIPKKEHATLAVLWQQQAGEFKALSYQAFNLAAARIKTIENTQEKPLAIITDLDETVLDNSPYSGMQIQKDLDYTKEDWIEWGKLKQAKALPGAVKFFALADSLNIEIFYISNRYNIQLEETVANMKELGLPNADTSHVFLRTNSSEKQERRDRVLENHEVVLYMGDNLSDFSNVFDNKSSEARNTLVDQMQESFGAKFIVFPNPMYGDWETKGVYENNRSWTDQQKDSIRHAKLISY